MSECHSIARLSGWDTLILLEPGRRETCTEAGKTCANFPERRGMPRREPPTLLPRQLLRLLAEQAKRLSIPVARPDATLTVRVEAVDANV